MYMYNEFDGIEKRGKGKFFRISVPTFPFILVIGPDLNIIPVGNDVPSELLKHCDSGDRDVFSPGVNHTWINPIGHWGSVWGNL